MDPRLDGRLAVCIAASHAWYADVFALHDIATATDHGLWRALAAPPPLHSAAKTLAPAVRTAEVVAAVAPYDVCSVADSFGDLDLAPHGFEVLIEATWLLHDALEATPMPAGWGPVRDREALATWVGLHGTPGVLPDPVLGHPRFTVLAGRDGAGAVVHDARAAVTVAHVFGDVPVTERLHLAAALHPGLPVSDYAAGTAVDESLAAGFVALGPQLVWAR